MDNRVCLINQPAGIGDVLFLQKMAKHFLDLGYSVYFPLLPQLLFIKDYIKLDNLFFCSVNDEFPYKELFNTTNLIITHELIYVPATYSDRYIGGSCLESKYKLINLDFSDWQDFLIFNRDLLKENRLFYDILKLKDDEEYCLINKRWGTPPNSLTKDVYYDFKGKIIEIDMIDGFNIFDWCKVIENASQISIVDTSFNYLIEKLELKSSKNYLTSRFTIPNFSHIINLFKTNWTFIQ